MTFFKALDRVKYFAKLLGRPVTLYTEQDGSYYVGSDRFYFRSGLKPIMTVTYEGKP